MFDKKYCCLFFMLNLTLLCFHGESEVFNSLTLEKLKGDYIVNRNVLLSRYAEEFEKIKQQYIQKLLELKRSYIEKEMFDEALKINNELERLKIEGDLILSINDITVGIVNRLLNLSELQKEYKKEKILEKDTENKNIESSVNKQGKDSVDKFDPVRFSYFGTNAVVEVSSTHREFPGEFEPVALVDGNLFTRWSSEYTAPQTVIIDLKKPVILDSIRLHWERACATRYAVYASIDKKNWQPVFIFMNDKVQAAYRVDYIPFKNIETRYIKLDLQSCVNTNWGFSLYEIEIIPDSKSLKY